MNRAQWDTSSSSSYGYPYILNSWRIEESELEKHLIKKQQRFPNLIKICKLTELRNLKQFNYKWKMKTMSRFNKINLLQITNEIGSIWPHMKFSRICENHVNINPKHRYKNLCCREKNKLVATLREPVSGGKWITPSKFWTKLTATKCKLVGWMKIVLKVKYPLTEQITTQYSSQMSWQH